ncbi:MAG: hypothetical protein ACK526_08230 [Planctomyces sp.]
MARRQHKNSVSLFPFLAVLVCTMGALILLLLVTTKKIRSDLVQKDSERSAASQQPQAIVVPPPVPADLRSEITDLQSRIDSLLSQRQKKGQQLDELKTSQDEKMLRLKKAGESVARLTSELNQLKDRKPSNAALVTLEKQIRDGDQKKQQLEQKVSRATKTLLEKQQKLFTLKRSLETQSVELHEKKSALVSLRKQVEVARQNQTATTGGKTLLEFSNPTGTSRTPIVVDVTDAGFHFLSSGIRVTARDMEGFPAKDNPLLSGVLASHRFRSGDSVTSEPYVLLLVRPDGCLPFYAAQRVLSENAIHYGYELLDAQRTIAEEPADPKETEYVRKQILETLTRRDTMYAALRADAEARLRGTEQSRAGGRRLVVRPDGRVVAGDADVDRPLDGRFYAGGEALPRNFVRNLAGPESPSGSQSSGTSGSSQLAESADNNENLRDRFSASGSVRGGSQQPPLAPSGTAQPGGAKPGAAPSATQSSGVAQSGRVPAGPHGESDSVSNESNTGSGSSTTANSIVRNEPNELSEYAEPKSPSDALASDGKMASGRVANDWQPKSLIRERGPKTLQSTADSTSKSSNDSLLNQWMGDDSGSNQASAGISGSDSGDQTPGHGRAGDLSHIDPELLGMLKAQKRFDRDGATPVGVTVFLDAEYMTIGQQPSIHVTPNSMNNAFGKLLLSINEEVAAARKKPGEPLMPVVKFVVSPGGEQLRIPLARELRSMGIASASVIEMSPYAEPDNSNDQNDTGYARVEVSEKKTAVPAGTVAPRGTATAPGAGAAVPGAAVRKGSRGRGKP